MRRITAILMAAALLLALAAPALAEATVLYVNQDSLGIYEGMSTETRLLDTLPGGMAVSLAGAYDGWYAVSYIDGYGVQQVGYAQAQFLSESMPPAYCSHVWSEWMVIQQPTCTSEGMSVRRCSVCWTTENRSLERTGHAFGEWTIAEEPTCTAQGRRVRSCATCGYTESATIDPIPHAFGRWTVLQEATCTQTGLRSRACEACGYVEQAETGLAPHEYGNWIMLAEPTCTGEGERVRRCVLCGYRDTQVLQALPHEYGEWTVTQPASCTAQGVRVRSCIFCGAQQSEAIEKLPHEFGDWTVEREATCAEAGLRARTCWMCGTRRTEEIARPPHDYAWVVTVEATDHSAGVRARQCQNCGAIAREERFDPEGTLRKGARGDEVRKLQQLLADQGYLTAGGVDGSYGGGTERAVSQFQRDQGLEPDGVAWPQTRQRLNHEFGEWRVSTPLTRNRDGVYVRTCGDCGYQERMTVEAGKPIERRQRGEEVRVIQTMLNDLGYNCGTADGSYGPKLDAAFGAFAAENDLPFQEGKVEPGDVDALVNAWIAEVPDAKWKGQGDRTTPVRLILTLTPAESGIDGVKTFEWKLTNMGGERCRIDGILLGFGEAHAFTADNLVMAVDGTVLARDGGNSASGSFSVGADWGEGQMCFCAVATSEKTGEVWLSNIRRF